MGSNQPRQPDAGKASDDELVKQRIKQAIDSKGLKLKQFSRESGMAYPSLRDYYRGMRKPGFEALATLVKFTGVSADWVLLGTGAMYAGDDPPMGDIDERVLGHIAQIVERELYHRPDPKQADRVAEGDGVEGLYALSRREFQEKLNRVGEQSVIAANVYNRIAHIEDPNAREAAINREVKALVRLNRGISATKITE